MRTEEALAVLADLQPALIGLHSEIGTRGDVAFLELKSDKHADRWARISTPGDYWFSIGIDGGFGEIRVEWDTEDSDVVSMLARYVDIGVAYLMALPEPRREGRLRLPRVRVQTDMGETVLSRTTIADLKTLLHIGRR